ncbi:MAG TPA: O-antigen ligase family protein [Gemmatimonadales bacterium]|nr:O-antigen ligase family protein [Gemmatimonadales bacterium]
MTASPLADLRTRAEPSRSAWLALLLLQVGAVAIVLAAAPYTLFDLERHTVPKELALHLAATGAAALCLVRAQRLSLSLADALVAAVVALSAVSALFATNHWLAVRSLGLVVSGALVFWTARALRAAGLARQLLLTLAAGVVLAAITALLQAYGVESPLFAERRAPGGAFGNRNFMAHFVAIGIPVLLLATLESRRRREAWLPTTSGVILGAALMLSRSRAAWLGTLAAFAILAVEGLWFGFLWRDVTSRRRILLFALALAVGGLLALLIPNTLEWRSDSPYLDSLRDVANYKEGSGRGRLVQYQNSLRMAAGHPVLGVGPGNWPVAYPRYTTPGDPAFDPDDFIPTNPWPSSDWVASLAERGALATLALAGAAAALAIGAWRRWRMVPETTEGTESLALILILATTAVVGSFDAVLLLPAPTFFVWAALGLLARAPKRPVFKIELRGHRARRLTAVVTTAGLVFAARNASQLWSMAAYGESGRVAAMEQAATIDPGSYRIRMLLAYAWRNRGRCDIARRHADRARALFPNHPAPGQLLAACRRP